MAGPDGAAEDGARGISLVFGVRPTIVFGYSRGESFSATRWRFAESGSEVAPTKEVPR